MQKSKLNYLRKLFAIEMKAAMKQNENFFLYIYIHIAVCV